jgi:hypothetical protein
MRTWYVGEWGRGRGGEARGGARRALAQRRSNSSSTKSPVSQQAHLIHCRASRAARWSPAAERRCRSASPRTTGCRCPRLQSRREAEDTGQSIHGFSQRARQRKGSAVAGNLAACCAAHFAADEAVRSAVRAAPCHSPLAITPSWFVARQLTMACKNGESEHSENQHTQHRVPGQTSTARKPTRPHRSCPEAVQQYNTTAWCCLISALTRCCCRKLCRKSPWGSFHFLRLSAPPAAGTAGAAQQQVRARSGVGGMMYDMPGNARTHTQTYTQQALAATHLRQRCAPWGRLSARGRPAGSGTTEYIAISRGAADGPGIWGPQPQPTALPPPLRRSVITQPRPYQLGLLLTFLWWVRVARVLPMRRSHSRTVLSWLEVTTCTAPGRGARAFSTHTGAQAQPQHCSYTIHCCGTPMRTSAKQRCMQSGRTWGSVGSARMEETVSSCPVRQWA